MNSNFGIDQKGTAILRNIFNNYPEVSRVLVYGSRAKGNFDDRSDLDLVIMDDIDRKILGEIWMEINSSDFPLTVDLQVWGDIKNKDLKSHISRVGMTLFKEATPYFSKK
ncbi:MAG: putative nucleotidyltransferase [Algoriphagus sp.]|jgi:predicted nucleotidyltransferase